MKNKPKFISRPKKKTKSVLKKTPAVKAALSGKKKETGSKKQAGIKSLLRIRASLRKIEKKGSCGKPRNVYACFPKRPKREEPITIMVLSLTLMMP